MTTTKIAVYPYAKLGQAHHGWLDTRYHFSFADYRSNDRMHFGALRVINDDRIAAGTGFPPHSHNDMEIITYVRQGAITHRDSMGNEGRTEAGDVQVMSAGTGIVHSEYNKETTDTLLYQIWIYPAVRNVTPCWGTKRFNKEPVDDRLQLLVSGRKEDANNNALFIHQDAAIYGGRMAAGTILAHPLKYQAYLLACDGTLEVNGQTLQKGDGAEITSTSTLSLNALTDAEILVIDIPPLA